MHCISYASNDVIALVPEPNIQGAGPFTLSDFLAKIW